MPGPQAPIWLDIPLSTKPVEPQQGDNRKLSVTSLPDKCLLFINILISKTKRQKLLHPPKLNVHPVAHNRPVISSPERTKQKKIRRKSLQAQGRSGVKPQARGREPNVGAECKNKPHQGSLPSLAARAGRPAFGILPHAAARWRWSRSFDRKVEPSSLLPVHGHGTENPRRQRHAQASRKESSERQRNSA